MANRCFKRSRGHVPRAKPGRRPRPSPRHSLGCRVQGLGFTGIILGLYIGSKGKENGNYCRVWGLELYGDDGKFGLIEATLAQGLEEGDFCKVVDQQRRAKYSWEELS